MPYKSDKQRRYFNANKERLEEEGVDVDEWNEESKGKDLPKEAYALVSYVPQVKVAEAGPIVASTLIPLLLSGGLGAWQGGKDGRMGGVTGGAVGGALGNVAGALGGGTAGGLGGAGIGALYSLLSGDTDNLGRNTLIGGGVGGGLGAGLGGLAGLGMGAIEGGRAGGDIQRMLNDYRVERGEEPIEKVAARFNLNMNSRGIPSLDLIPEASSTPTRTITDPQISLPASPRMNETQLSEVPIVPYVPPNARVSPQMTPPVAPPAAQRGLLPDWNETGFPISSRPAPSEPMGTAPPRPRQAPMANDPNAATAAGFDTEPARLPGGGTGSSRFQPGDVIGHADYDDPNWRAMMERRGLGHLIPPVSAQGRVRQMAGMYNRPSSLEEWVYRNGPAIERGILGGGLAAGGAAAGAMAAPEIYEYLTQDQ